MWEIIGGVARHHDLVAKIKIVKFFPGMFDGDSQKFMLAKISCYTVSSQWWEGQEMRLVWTCSYGESLCSHQQLQLFTSWTM